MQQAAATIDNARAADRRARRASLATARVREPPQLGQAAADPDRAACELHRGAAAPLEGYGKEIDARQSQAIMPVIARRIPEEMIDPLAFYLAGERR